MRGNKCGGPALLLTVNNVQVKTLQANEQTAPQALPGSKWLSLLHVRGVLIPALNELANGRPFPLTRFPHIYTPSSLGLPTRPSEAGGMLGLTFHLSGWP